ncbi:unnamed protein product [Acidithrix sp. C25]|nr:unnamed protein product [Acidithrix sp. C25]
MDLLIVGVGEFARRDVTLEACCLLTYVAKRVYLATRRLW